VVQWVDNDPFDAVLTFTGFERGRSAAHAIWVDNEGHEYQMFLTDFSELLLDGGTTMVGGKVLATWRVRKRGRNYGIALA
jgi:hypothetical protein